MIEYDFTFTGDEELMAKIEQAPQKARNAVRMSINRIATQMRTELAREAAQDYFVKIGDVKKSIKLTKASDNLMAVLESSGRPIPLIKFRVTPAKVQYRGRRGRKIKVRVRRDSSGARLNRAFVAFMGTTTNVFERKGKPRFPVKKLYGPSIPQMLRSEDVMTRITRKAQDSLNTEITHQLNRLLK